MGSESDGLATRRAARRSWAIRVYPLGAEPRDDLSGTTTAPERLAMVWPLTLEAWTLAGFSVPRYARHETPIARRSWPPSAGREPGR